jgi:HSP20 family protein
MSLKSLIPVGRGRNAMTYHPFASIHRELDRMLEDFGRGFPGFGSASESMPQALTPATDVVETDKEIQITAELPGLEDKDVKIDLSDNVLTIRGEKKAEREEKDQNYRMIERSYGSFMRSLELPAGVDAGAIKATIANGVLKVTVPKPAPAQAKTIEVKSAK